MPNLLSRQEDHPRSFLGYAIAIMFGFAAGVICFLLWAVLEMGAQ